MERNLVPDRTPTTGRSPPAAVMRTEPSDEKIRIDNAELTADETVGTVLSATGLTPLPA